MVLDFQTSDLLHYTDLWQFERKATSYAIDLAVLGEPDYAREVINIILREAPLSPGQFKRNAQVLAFVWQQTGKWPDKWPENLRSDETLQQLRQSYEKAWGKMPEAQRSYDKAGLERCLDPKSGPIWGEQERLVKALDIALGIEAPPTLPTKGPGEKSIQLDDLNEELANVIRRVASHWKSSKLEGNDLALAERLWPYFESGILVEAVGLTQKEVKGRGSMLVAAVHQRLRHPYAKTMMHDKSIEELVQIADYNTVSTYGPGSLDWKPYGKKLPATITRDPASPKTIADAESRLGVALPADYKELLQITNGLGNDGVGIFGGHLSEMELYKAEDLNWTEAEFEMPIDLIEVGSLYYEITEQDKWEAENGSNWDFTDDFPQFSRYIIIGQADVHRLVLIPPEDVGRMKTAIMELYNIAEGPEKIALRRALESFAGSMEEFEKLEWCCLDWIDESNYGHQSFKRWLEEKVSGSFKQA